MKRKQRKGNLSKTERQSEKKKLQERNTKQNKGGGKSTKLTKRLSTGKKSQRNKS